MSEVTHTRIKILGLLFCSTGMLFIRDIRVSLITAGVIVACSYIFQAKTAIKDRLLPILTVCFFVIIFQLIFNTSVPVVIRFLLGIVSSLRILSLSLLVFLFTETTSIASIVDALSFLPGSLRLMITISFALIPAIMYELTSIKMAQQARGSKQSFLPLLIPLLNRTLSRAEHIAMVMETRGYQR